MFKQLYPYQEKRLADMPAKCLFSWDLGTGKTASSLVHYIHKAYPQPLLIIAPASKIRTEDWQVEARDVFNAHELKLPEIVYISYERLRLMDQVTKRPRWWQYTAARNGGKQYAIICDEAHACKNPQSKQSKAVFELTRGGSFFAGLSGSLLPNGWIDFAGYSKLFGFTHGITEFKQKYCRYTDYKGFPELIGYNNEREMERQLKQIAYKLDRNQAAELPARQMIGVNIQLTPKASKLYKTCKLKRQHPETEELLDNAPRLLSVLRQSTTDSRLDNLLSIVNDTSDNIVVYYNYISEREAILKALATTDKTILRSDGEVHDKLPAANANTSNTVLVAHYKSASTGLNLQWANVTVYFSPSYSYGEFEQSIGRTHRQGQAKKCLYYLFNVRATVDRDIWRCLRDKRDFNDKLWKAEDD